jgi:putative RNA 2'-phosphotransferase
MGDDGCASVVASGTWRYGDRVAYAWIVKQSWDHFYEPELDTDPPILSEALVDELLVKSAAAGTRITKDDLFEVVATNEKKRFTLSDDRQRIRAAQGHSIAVNLGLTPGEPPGVLYHGTATRFLEAILSEGLRPMSRQQVHLSADERTARQVGQRHGKPIVVVVQARRMHDDGFRFFLAENHVWLTDRVPPEYLAPASGAADPASTSTPPKPKPKSST